MQLTIATAAALALVYARSAFAVMGIDTPYVARTLHITRILTSIPVRPLCNAVCR